MKFLNYTPNIDNITHKGLVTILTDQPTLSKILIALLAYDNHLLENNLWETSKNLKLLIDSLTKIKLPTEEYWK